MNSFVANTPITELKGYEETGNRLFMKRDDLQPFAFGGNKVRIAAAFLEDLKAKGCDAMLMYGDLRSNLCRVLALLCRSEQIPARMIGTSENDPDGGMSFNERIILRTGTEVVTCAKDGIAETVTREMERFRAEGRKPYYIYGNELGEGNEGCAASAYADAWGEITDWERKNGLRFDAIVTPYGTGATQAGLAAGMLLENIRTGGRSGRRRVTGISISSRTYERSMKSLEDGLRGVFERENISLPADAADALELHTEYNGGGYGLVDARVRAEAERMLLTNGIGLCAMYTGKAFRGMLDLLEKERAQGKNILFLNTGGLPIFFDDLLSMEEPY